MIVLTKNSLKTMLLNLKKRENYKYQLYIIKTLLMPIIKKENLDKKNKIAFIKQKKIKNYYYFKIFDYS